MHLSFIAVTPESLNKIIPILDRIFVGIVVFVWFLAIIVIAGRWEFLQHILPLPVFFELRTKLIFVAWAGSLLSFLALIVLTRLASFHNNLIRRLIFLIIGFLSIIPIWCVLGFVDLSPERIANFAQMDQTHYFATKPTNLSRTLVDYVLYKCNRNDFDCMIVHKEVVGGPYIYPTSLTVDNLAHEVHFFVGRWLVYSDGQYPHAYEPVTIGIAKNSKFSLLRYEKDTAHEFVLTKCDGEFLDNISCKVLPFHYSAKTFEKAELVEDKSAKAIQLWIDHRLILTYDTTLHCHSEGCIINSP